MMMTSTDPLWHLSSKPDIGGLGYYPADAPTPRMIELERPLREFKRDKRRGEDFMSFLERRAKDPDWPQWQEEFCRHGLDIDHVCMLNPPLVTPPFTTKRRRRGFIQWLKNLFSDIERGCP